MSSSMLSVAARSIQKYKLAKYPERTKEATVSSKQNSACRAPQLSALYKGAQDPVKVAHDILGSLK